MRLIDADALLTRSLWSGPLDGQVVSVESIMAAPTISCAACERDLDRDWSVACEFCRCGSHFQRRQS